VLDGTTAAAVIAVDQRLAGGILQRERVVTHVSVQRPTQHRAHRVGNSLWLALRLRDLPADAFQQDSNRRWIVGVRERASQLDNGHAWRGYGEFAELVDKKFHDHGRGHVRSAKSAGLDGG
jgi:hypothetical protein